MTGTSVRREAGDPSRSTAADLETVEVGEVEGARARAMLDAYGPEWDQSWTAWSPPGDSQLGPDELTDDWTTLAS